MNEPDPRIVTVASECLRELVSEVGRQAIDGRHDELRDRLAKAMQQACEQEYDALVEELTA